MLDKIMHYGYFPVGVQSPKQLFFFLRFGFATGRVCREKNVFLAFLLSLTLRFHPHSRPLL